MDTEHSNNSGKTLLKIMAGIFSLWTALSPQNATAENEAIKSLKTNQKKLEDLLANDGRHDAEYKRKANEYCKMTDEERYKIGLHETLMEKEDQFYIKWINDEPHYMVSIESKDEVYTLRYVSIKDFKSARESQIVNEKGEKSTTPITKEEKRQIYKFCERTLGNAGRKYPPFIWPTKLMTDDELIAANRKIYEANREQLKKLSQ